MPNITFSVSDVLYEKMKKFPEIKWSTLYRQTIEQYLEKLEHPNIIPITELREKLRKNGITMDDLTHEQVIENYKKMKELEWERTSSIRTG
jgi:hypothetical protein